MKAIRTIAAAGVIILALTGLPAETLAQACVSQGEGQQMVAQGQVVPFPVAASRAGIASNEVVSVSLCRGGGGYIYRVKLRQGGTKNIPAN